MRLIDADALMEFITDKAETEVDAVIASVCRGAALSMPTIDPIRAAGGCYCRECRRCDGFPDSDIEQGEVGICKVTGLMVHADGWCKWSKLKEVQGDGKENS